MAKMSNPFCLISALFINLYIENSFAQESSDLPLRCFVCFFDEKSGNGMSECVDENLNDFWIQDCNTQLGEDVCYMEKKVTEQDNYLFINRTCGVSSRDFGGETDLCESYIRFGEENHACVCQDNYCNEGSNLKALSVAVMFSLLAVAANK